MATSAAAITELLKAVKKQQESTIFQKLAKMVLSCENLGSGMIGKHQTIISVIDRKNQQGSTEETIPET